MAKMTGENKGILSKANGFIDRYRLIHYPLLIFLFFQPFSRYAGIRNTAFVIMLLCFIAKLLNSRINLYIKDKTVLALLFLVGVSVFVSIIGPYPAESIHAIRKNLFYQVIIFFVIISEYRGMDDLKPIFYATMGGFAALTIMIFYKNDITVLLNWLEHHDRMTPQENRETFFGGYSLHATFYIPLTIGYLYSVRERLSLKSLMVIFILLELILVFLHNHRTQFVAIIFSTALVTLLARRYKLFAVGIVAVLIAGVILFQSKPDTFARYKTLLSYETYLTNENRGWNDRLSIWEGTIDMISQRPLFGYGYGWKKIATVAREKGFLERWEKEKSGAYNYFNDKGYGSANPHNLVLQIIFEIGLLGLSAFIFFWTTIIIKVYSISRKGLRRGPRFLAYGTTGVLIAYGVINISNGLWEEVAGNLMMALAGISLVIYEECLSMNSK